MPSHIRTQILTAVASALAGLPTTGSNVFRGRVYPLQDAELPGLKVDWTTETSAPETIGTLSLVDRKLQVTVLCVVKASPGTNDLLDQICKEVELALATPCAALAGLALSCALQSSDITQSGAAEKPAGEVRMTYEIEYMNAETAPDVAL
jgi:hypothetical protein